MSTAIRIPLQLSTVNLGNANAFWTTKDGSNYDYGYVAFKDAATGTATYMGIVPQNLASSPQWNLVLHHTKNASGGAGNNVVLSVSALDLSDSATVDDTLTSLISSQAVACDGTALDLTITSLSGSNFDGTEALAAGNLLVVEISREGGDANDNIDTQWNLLGVYLHANVN